MPLKQYGMKLNPGKNGLIEEFYDAKVVTFTPGDSGNWGWLGIYMDLP